MFKMNNECLVDLQIYLINILVRLVIFISECEVNKCM